MTVREIGIGIVGWGGIARVHAMALAALPIVFPDAPFIPRLVAVATRDPIGKGEAIRRAGFRRAVHSPAELIAEDQVEGISICTPNALHAEAAMPAWAAGKSVYCEKPLAEGLAAAERIAAGWRQAGDGPPALSQMAFILRFWPAVARARDWIDQGRIGEVLTFRARMLHGGYLDERRAYSWRLDQGLSGGGALADLGVHLIDLVRFLLGPVERLTARTRTFVPERPLPGGGRARVAVDDWAEITCTLRSGAAGSIEASRVSDGQEGTALEIFGREGSIRIGSDSPFFPHLYDRRQNRMAVRGGPEGEAGPFTRAALSVWPPAKLSLGPFVDAHLASLHWWLRRLAAPAFTAGTPPLAAGIEDGLEAQKVLEQAYASARAHAGTEREE